MKVDPYPRLPADSAQLYRKLVDLFREYGQEINDSLKFDRTLQAIDQQGVQFNGDWLWHDMLGPISIRGVGASDPSYNVLTGGIRGYQFDANEEVFVEFHVPHDYVPGTDLYLHFHWSVNGKTTAGVTGGTITGGTVTWGAEVTYAKGHAQAAFAAPVTFTVASQTVSSTLLKHYITEGQLSASSPSASQLDTDILETDGLILVRGYLSANNITVGSGATPAPFLHMIDIHYQSSNLGTRNKSPSFYFEHINVKPRAGSLTITGLAPTVTVS